MKIRAIPVLQDNYSYLLIDEPSKRAAVVDVSEVEPVLAEVDRLGVEIRAILSTHHHLDHVGGNLELAARRAVEVLGNAEDGSRIPGLTRGVRDGETIDVIGLRATVITIPAHTSGHIAFYFPDEQAVFTGDTLFAAGCGRLFEGQPAQMMASLARLDSLPESTRVYCGHEYTVRNLEFAATLEPTNPQVQARLAWARNERAANRPTVPTTIRAERETNPFMRVSSRELRRSVQASEPSVGEDDVAIFAAVRRLKDSF